MRLVLALGERERVDDDELALARAAPRAPSAAPRAAPTSAAGTRSRAAAARRSIAPPAQIGERLLPARARPVPFCFHGFLPPPRDEGARLGRVRAGAARRELDLHHLVEQVLAHRARRRPPPAASTSPTAARVCDDDRNASPSLGGHDRASRVRAPARLRPVGRARCRCARPAPRRGRAAGSRRRAPRRPRGCCVVTRSAPMRPAMRLPLKTRPGIRAVADRAAVPEVLVRAVRRREAAEVVALDDAAVAAALGDAGHLDDVAGLEDVGDGDRRRRPSSVVAVAERNSRSMPKRRCARLLATARASALVSALRLRARRSRAAPRRSRRASASSPATTVHGPASITVTGTSSPAAV